MKPCSWYGRFPPPAGLEPGIARTTACALPTELPGLLVFREEEQKI